MAQGLNNIHQEVVGHGPGRRHLLQGEGALWYVFLAAAKVGGILNGYRIGTYVAERLRSSEGVPDGFIEVWPEAVDLQVTSNLRLSDFITHDARQETVWPKYVAMSPRLLDKLYPYLARSPVSLPA